MFESVARVGDRRIVEQKTDFYSPEYIFSFAQSFSSKFLS